MKVITKRQERNEKINYNRLVVAVEGIIAKKQAYPQSGATRPFSTEIAQAIEDIKFWKGRLSELRDKCAV